MRAKRLTKEQRCNFIADTFLHMQANKVDFKKNINKQPWEGKKETTLTGNSTHEMALNYLNKQLGAIA